MKKKLIAIVASLAMVATMVPSAAFAGVNNATTGATAVTDVGTAVTVNNAGGIISMGLAAPSSVPYTTWLTTDGNIYEAKTEQWKFNEAVTGEYKDGKLVLKGIVPYTNKEFDPKRNTTESIYDPAERAGHYIGLQVKALNPDVDNVAGWALAYSSEEKQTTASSVETGTINKLYTYSDFTSNKEFILKRLPENGNFTYTIYYLTANGIKTFAKYSWEYRDTKDSSLANPFESLFGKSTFTGANKNATVEGKNDDQTVKYDTNEDMTLTAAINEAKNVNGIAATQTLSVDTSGLTLLTEEETKDIALFVKGVNEIKVGAITTNDNVDKEYRAKTKLAASFYEDLDAKAKAAVDSIVESDKISDTNRIKKAYKDLETAQKNVAAFDQLDAVAKQIIDLPNVENFDLADTASVKQVSRVQAAVDALTDGAENALKNVDEGYLTKKQWENYEALIKKVGDTAVKSVIDQVNALKKPAKFTDKASVDAISEPFMAARKAYKNLSAANQTKVDGETSPTISAYETSYLAELKKYVDAIWEKAAKIDVDQPLTAEDIALVTELRDYVEGNYLLDTDTIEGFKPATYDALIAALGNGYDLSEAAITLADADNIVYDGTKKTPAVTVTDQAGKEIAADNYTVIYSDNKDAGEATVTVAAKGSTYTGSTSTTFTIKPAALTDAMVKSVANTTYTGKAVTPAVTVDKGVTYEVTYSKNTAVGKATATITGTGNYTGTITKNFIVKPAKEAISSLKAGKKSLTVAYKAQTGAKYRIVYSPAKGQAKAVNTTATKKTIKSLKAGKTYKVKVRAYKTIDGTTYNGTYSTVKKVKVK